MNQTIFLSCAVFLLYLFLLPSSASHMFSDPDTYWHIAAGDVIRASGLPAHDPWSFTAGSEPWYNISWAWDAAASAIYQHAGWHGVIAFNSATAAAALALVFAACLLRTREGISAFLATMLAAVTLYHYSVRPLQATALFTALMMLVLPQVASRAISCRWLLLVPFLMLAWVNIHGGFLIAFFLLGIYGLDALLKKDWPLFRWLCVSAVASLAAVPANPYGAGVMTGVFHTLHSDAHAFIHEWQPFSFSGRYFQPQVYVALFFVLVMMRRLPLPRAEKWVAYSWLALGMLSTRHLGIFAVVSPPLLALGLHSLLIKPPQRPLTPLARRLCALGSGKSHAIALLLLAGCASLLMFTPQAARLYGTASYQPLLPELAGDIRHVSEHYAGKRLLTSFSLGGPLIMYARGSIPVFIDGREQTAYPQGVIRDYVAFHNAVPHWADMLTRYKLEGALLMSHDLAAIDRLAARKGWEVAFRGKMVTLLLRDNQ